MSSRKMDGYLGNSNLKPAGINIEFTKDQVAEYVKCAKDPVYFIKTYVKDVSLEKDTNGDFLVPFHSVIAIGDFVVISEEDIL